MTGLDLAALPALWEFYFCSIEKHPASIMVDLAWEPHAPVRGHAELVEVEFALLSPDADGLSDTSEAPRLFALEDQLATAMSEDLNALYVGRLTGKGRRVFYFYAPTTLRVESLLGHTMQDYPEYLWFIRYQHDPAWKMFFELLLPSEEEAHLIKNRRALDELAQRGDQLQMKRPLVHQFTFPGEKQVQSFLKKAAKSPKEGKVSEEKGHWALCLTTQSSMLRQELDEQTWTFAQQAKAAGGTYLGWKTDIVKVR